MKTFTVVACVAATALLAACVVMPVGPMVAALPGSQKSIDQFRQDDEACRGLAQAAVNGPTPSATWAYPTSVTYELQRQFDSTYLRCMYTRGHRVPAGFIQQAPAQRYFPPNSPPRDYPPPSG